MHVQHFIILDASNFRKQQEIRLPNLIYNNKVQKYSNHTEKNLTLWGVQGATVLNSCYRCAFSFMRLPDLWLSTLASSSPKPRWVTFW
jgi:hypothetical protein